VTTVGTVLLLWRRWSACLLEVPVESGKHRADQLLLSALEVRKPEVWAGAEALGLDEEAAEA
jgi:hypothetical protein